MFTGITRWKAILEIFTIVSIVVEGEKFDRHNLIMATCVTKGGRS